MKTLAVILVITSALAGCAKVGAKGGRAKEQTIKIGLLVTTGGKGGDLAGPSIGAANVAAEHLDEDRVAKVKIEQADYQGDLSAAAGLVQELAKKVDAIVVGTDDEAILPALSALDLPVMYPYLTGDGIASRPNTFRLAPSDSLQAKVLADYLIKRRHLSRFGVIFANTPYGNHGQAKFAEAAERLGGRIVASSPFDSGGDIHTPVMLAGDQGAEAVVVWTDDPAEAARITIDVNKSAQSYQLALPSNTAVPQFGKNAVAQVVPTAFKEGILSVGPWAGPWLDSPRIRRFYKDFETKQSDLAPVRTAQAYDAVVMLARAKASTSIIKGLSSMKDFLGASVPVTFGNDHEGMDASDLWAWGFTKSKNGNGADFFPAVDTGGGFFTLIYDGLKLPKRFRFMLGGAA